MSRDPHAPGDDELDQGPTELFPVTALPAVAPTSPLPPAGGNLAALNRLLDANPPGAELGALVEHARTLALAQDVAVRQKGPTYALAPVAKPYQDALRALGLGGLDPSAQPVPAAGAGAGDVILGVFGRAPTVPPA